MLNTIGKIVAILLLPFLGYGFGMALYEIVSKSNWQTAQVFTFGIGFIAFAVFWLLFSKFLEVFCTFEHELTHLIVGLLFFKRPKSFKVTFTKGGHVELYGGKNFLVTLAPYFLPTVSYLLLPFAWILPKDSLPIYFGILGAASSFHLFSGWQEFHFGQSDLHDAGITFSVLFLPVANLIFFGAILALVIGNGEGFLSFWKQGFLNGFGLVKWLIQLNYS